MLESWIRRGEFMVPRGRVDWRRSRRRERSAPWTPSGEQIDRRGESVVPCSMYVSILSTLPRCSFSFSCCPMVPQKSAKSVQRASR